MKYIMIFLSVFFTGCSMAKYTDVSHEEKFKMVINKDYVTLKELMIHGVTLDRNYKKNIDIYSITEMAGFSGPEVVSKNILSKGTIFKIIRVVRCTSCWPEYIEFEIKILSTTNIKESIPIRLNDLTIIKNNSILMNPKYFKEIEKRGQVQLP